MTTLDRDTRKTTSANDAAPSAARSSVGATSLVAQAQSASQRGAAPAQAQAAPAAGGVQIDWFSEPFQLTHYTFALEDDPRYASDPLVQAPGLNEPHREGFLYSDTGILMQGTGKASNGKYITVDWNRGGPAGRNTPFTYGVGGTGGTPSPWKTVASDPGVVPLGSRLVIEAYRSKGEFKSNDTGGAIKGHHLDIFVGAVPIQEAFALGTKSSRVGIIKSGSLGDGAGQGQDQGQGQEQDDGGHPVLRRGSTGAAVERLQHKVGVAADGDFGPATERAVIAFQQSHGLGADGVVGPQTWAALEQGTGAGAGSAGSHSTLRQGATGAEVEALQRRLGVAADGDFGPATQAAVIAFQQSHGLDADGVVGPQTWSALERGGGATPNPTPRPQPAPTRPELRRGSTGSDVIALQKRLGIQQTGTFGPTTEGIVKQFQQSHGLEATGVVDARTWAAIDAAASSANVTANPNSENVLVGTSGGALGDRLLPRNLNLDQVMPHHGDAGDRHELRAVEFDGAGNVATSTWPTSEAVPRVVIDGHEVRVTNRLPAPILNFLNGITATDFTVGKRSDPNNSAYDIGRPVYAPFDMKVVQADASQGFMALEKLTPLTLDLGNGKTAQLYERIAVLHLDTVLVGAGQTVKAGHKIATQGHTGTEAVHQHIAGSNSIRIDFINAQTRAFAAAP